MSSQPPYRHGATVTLSCPSGYKLTGSGTQTCGKGGLWSPGIPECERKSDVNNKYFMWLALSDNTLHGQKTGFLFKLHCYFIKLK